MSTFYVKTYVYYVSGSFTKNKRSEPHNVKQKVEDGVIGGYLPADVDRALDEVNACCSC